MGKERKSIVELSRGILRVLARGDEMSVKAISEAVGSQWDTTERVLMFLKELGIVKERKGKIGYKAERLFRKS